MRFSRTVLPSLLLAALAAPVAVAALAPVAAASTQNPSEFIETLSDKAFTILNDKSVSRIEAKTRFRAMLFQHVAVKSIGDRLIRSHRAQITPQQYAAYSQALPNYIVGAYADRLYEYANADLKVVRVRPVGSGYAVYSQVVQPNQARPIDAVWSIAPSPDGYKITNLTVSGVNMALTQEADFSSVIQRRGFDALVQFMQSKRW